MMNEKELETLLRRDTDLHEAISRHEQALPPMPDDLNARVLQRMKQPDAKPKRRIWLYTASAVAASVLLLLLFRFVQDTPEAPVVAMQHPVQTKVEQPQEALAQPNTEVVKEAPSATPQRKSPVRKARRSQPIEEEDTLPAQTEEPDVEQEFVDPTLIYFQMTGDPVLAAVEHVRDIRARGERFQQEVELVLHRSMQSFNN
ncbi:MAG: hypothetical protein K2O61_09280 [Bacteroidaceae bacterium]|nr:hypothetical protein [Bacteroidaceae bacterium]